MDRYKKLRRTKYLLWDIYQPRDENEKFNMGVAYTYGAITTLTVVDILLALGLIRIL